MRKILIFLLVIGSCHLFDVGLDVLALVDKSPPNHYSLGYLGEVYNNYKSGFDTIVEFTSLNEAINSIGESMLTYKGKAKNKFELLKKNDLESTYIKFVKPMFDGCNHLNKTLDLYAIPHINNKSLSNDERDHILNITIDELKNLQTKTLESSTFMKDVQKKAEEVSELLKAMDIDVSHANSKVDELKMQLNEEMTNVYAFELFINGTCEYLPHFLNFQHKLRRHLVPLSKKFGKACYEFHMTHNAQLGIN